ncbi:MAG: hypothetical protein AB7O52_06025 [Planctomycetota bacterium]
MFRERWGEADGLSGGAAIVALRRDAWGRWCGRIVDRGRRESNGLLQARLIPAFDALCIGGNPVEVDQRRQSLRTVLGADLLESPITSTRDHVALAVCRRRAITDLGDGVRGVPAATALARLGRCLDPGHAVGVYWGIGSTRFVGTWAPGGRAFSAAANPRWYALTPVDGDGRRLLRAHGVVCAASPPPGILPTLPPSATLALGVALAARDPGTFPALPRPAWSGYARDLAVGTGLVLASLRAVHVEEQLRAERSALRTEQEWAERERLERALWTPPVMKRSVDGGVAE